MFKHTAFRTALRCFRQENTLIVEENGFGQFCKV